MWRHMVRFKVGDRVYCIRRGDPKAPTGFGRLLEIEGTRAVLLWEEAQKAWVGLKVVTSPAKTMPNRKGLSNGAAPTGENGVLTVAQIAALTGLSLRTVTRSLRMSGASSSSGVPSPCTSGAIGASAYHALCVSASLEN